MISEEIKNALEDGVDLSDEEYRARSKAADAATESHGMTEKAPVSEAKRARRIQSNFYGTALNILCALYSVAEEILTILRGQEEGNGNE